MAAPFERDRASRWFYSLASDPEPESPGGIPIGSFWTHTDTGDVFIFAGKGSARQWCPFKADATNELLRDLILAIRDTQDALVRIQDATEGTAERLTDETYPRE